MEHAIAHGILGLLHRIDSRFQKPLNRVIPDLEQLYADLAKALSNAEITIGPMIRNGTGTFFGLWFGFVLAFVGVMTVWDPHGLFAAPAAAPFRIPASCLVSVICLLVSVWVALRFSRGGICTLSGRGVDFRYAGRTVSCPWALFNAPGETVFQDTDSRFRRHVILPVAPAAVGCAEAHEKGRLIGQGMAIETRQMRFATAIQARLEDLYEVNIEDVAALLHELGGTLSGDVLPGAHIAPTSQDVGELPPASAAQDGWITVQVSRLVLPPFCCQCGAHAAGTQELCTRNVGYAQKVAVRFPICESCQAAIRTGTKIPAFVGLGVGVLALVGASVGLWFMPDMNVAGWLLCVGVLLFVMPIGGFRLGRDLAMRKLFPARLGGYSPKKGTLKVRFSNPKYAEAMLAATNAPLSLTD